ncbi:MAG: transposase [Candidatus Vogelbacteria bacterium]|nr:transposase [Candidatus Vogelbacteria bacterium]
MERKTIFTEGEWYHLYNRGTDKRKIFTDNNDYQRFLKLLYLANSTKPTILYTLKKDTIFDFPREENLVDIGAYCLMPNHFHLLVKEKVEGGISLFMRKLLTGYSMYFNIKNKRTGKLFEGPFKSIHVDTDNYFRYVLSYIHLNPVKLVEPEWKEKGVQNKDRVKNFLQSYSPSSHLDYLKLSEKSPRIERWILATDDLPIEIKSRDFVDELNDWLEYQTMLKLDK